MSCSHIPATLPAVLQRTLQAFADAAYEYGQSEALTGAEFSQLGHTEREVCSLLAALVAAHQSVIEWCHPDPVELPQDPIARAECLTRRLGLIANASRAALQKAGVP